MCALLHSLNCERGMGWMWRADDHCLYSQLLNHGRDRAKHLDTIARCQRLRLLRCATAHRHQFRGGEGRKDAVLKVRQLPPADDRRSDVTHRYYLPYYSFTLIINIPLVIM